MWYSGDFHFTFWQRFYPQLFVVGGLLVAAYFNYGTVWCGFLFLAGLIWLVGAVIGCAMTQANFEMNVRRVRQFNKAVREDTVPEFRRGDFDRWNKHRL